MPSQPVEFDADRRDGGRHTLHGHLHRPAASAPRAAVVIHPATAVPERFYLAFADYLTAQGLAVLTYDYRGIGRSAPPSLRGFEASMRDWMELDVPAATAFLEAGCPGLPLLAIGHSVGGHALGISASTAALRAGVIVAAHAGVTALIESRRERWRVRLLMRALGPALTALLGYMPGARLGLGENLPAGVMREWGRWTALPRYFFDDPALRAAERFAQPELPLLVLGFSDDPWANPRAMDLLVKHFVNAPRERRQIRPADVGLRTIGHMGFFRRQNGEALWPAVAGWLLAQANGPRPAAEFTADLAADFAAASAADSAAGGRRASRTAPRATAASAGVAAGTTAGAVPGTMSGAATGTGTGAGTGARTGTATAPATVPGAVSASVPGSRATDGPARTAKRARQRRA